ncbi:RAMP superfamily CRISPR-associated protein [Phycisphaerales bacterium]|nr:RAMP superfamily CRISPR-associated protein [Phycisphaerales bacterium]
MIDALLRIRTSSDWLISSTRSSGEADLQPLVDECGLPIIPGRSLRGLLRSAVREASALIDSSVEDAMFGIEGIEGRFAIGDARLPAEIISSIDAKEAETRDLFTIRRRTAIDASTGTAMAGSLRAIEVVVPGLVLHAPVAFKDPEDLPRLAFAASLIRRLGMGRSRGLGRCTMDFLHAGDVISGETFCESGGTA